MSTFLVPDPVTGILYEVPGKSVACGTPDCMNLGQEIEVPDDPNGNVVCGPCGSAIPG